MLYYTGTLSSRDVQCGASHGWLNAPQAQGPVTPPAVALLGGARSVQGPGALRDCCCIIPASLPPLCAISVLYTGPESEIRLQVYQLDDWERHTSWLRHVPTGTLW